MIFLLYLALYCSAFEFPWDRLDISSETATSTSEEPFDSTSANSTQTKEDSFYSPLKTACPSGLVLREALLMNDQEKRYIENRHIETNAHLISFLSNVSQLNNFDAEAFVNGNRNQHNISIALAYSGGGYRAMLCGAGELLALDSRFSNLTNTALGGLLQSASYLSGLSGGSWLLGTLVLNDWMSVEEVLSPESGIWNLDSLIFNPNGINVFETLEYYLALRDAVNNKEAEGFKTSITDIWGRALSYQFFNPQDSYHGGENVTWHGITQLHSFKKFQMPFPIVLANGRTPGTTIISSNSTIIEVTPFELGSWDPSLNSFVDIKYLGSHLDNGVLNNDSCYTNYDNSGFILGTLSSLFNQVLLRVTSSTTLNWAIKKMLTLILSSFSRNNVDIATYNPNPFRNAKFAASKLITSNPTLDLVDGGEDGQNVPLFPFIQQSREVDIIFAFDNSADSNQWPNGTSLVHTYQRQFSLQGKGSPFPYVPTPDVFLEEFQGRPVFFGCDAANLTELIDYHGTDMNETDIPLVVYMPNTEYQDGSNTSTYKMSYSRDEMLGLVTNGYEVSSRGNYSSDELWPTCVGCAIIRRQQERLGSEQSEECKSCFERYCWKGDLTDSATSSSVSISSLATTAHTSSSSTATRTESLLRSKTNAAVKNVPSLYWLVSILLQV